MTEQSEQPTSPGQGIVRDEDEALRSPAPTRRERLAAVVVSLGVFGTVRLLVGLCGLAGFVVGILTAWHSGASTTILIVSGILLVLAALGLDWDEIRGTYGGATLQLLRSGLKNVGEEIERVAADNEVSPAVREELESLREQVKALTPDPPARPARTTLRGTSGPPAGLDELWKEVMKTKATHAFPRGLHAATLSLQIATSDKDARYRCTIKTPGGSAYSAVGTPRVEMNPMFFRPRRYEITYPDDFRGSEPLQPGTYEVEWRPAPLVDPLETRSATASATSLLASVLAQTTRPPVAVDAFTIPAGGASEPATA